MPEFAALLIAYALSAYAGIGILVALWAHVRGIDAHDPDVRQGSIGFRVLITPGLIALWPLVARGLVRQGGIRPAAYDAPHDGSERRLPYRSQPSLAALAVAAAAAILILGWMTLTGSAA